MANILASDLFGWDLWQINWDDFVANVELSDIEIDRRITIITVFFMKMKGFQRVRELFVNCIVMTLRVKQHFGCD